MREMNEKLLRAKEEASLYTEHDTPDGKKYYFNSKTNQSVWDKPKCLIDVTGTFFYWIWIIWMNLKKNIFRPRG